MSNFSSQALFAHGPQVSMPGCENTHFLPQNTSKTTNFPPIPSLHINFCGEEAVGRACGEVVTWVRI